MASGALLIACGALARELVALLQRNNWNHIRIQCLPAELHNRPEQIPAAVEAAIKQYRDDYEHVFVAYADCGTGGLLDRVLEKYGVARIAGAHCYEFYSGTSIFENLAAAELGTFYLTDFMVRHFDRLVVEGLGLDQHPELRDAYFGNYKKVVYLSQSGSGELSRLAREQSKFLGLEYAEHFTGLTPVEEQLKEHAITWQK